MDIIAPDGSGKVIHLTEEALHRLGIKRSPRLDAEERKQQRLEKYEARLAAGVSETRKDRCWEWTGARDPGGYGILTNIDSRKVRAHRAYYEKYHGPIPPGMYVCHKCDNPPCVNPNHLFLGTPADNMQDLSRKKRTRRSASQQRSERERMINREAWILLKGGIPFERICQIYRLTKTQLDSIMVVGDKEK